MKTSFKENYKNLLVIDIETASQYENFQNMEERMQELWRKKAAFLMKEEKDTAEELYFDKGAIYAEFGKVICISVGIFTKENEQFGLRIKSFADDDEEKVLSAFKELIERKFVADKLQLIAHNGKEFDFPYMCRRMLVNAVEIPDSLKMQDKKPWEINHIDTMELWKFGDRKNFTSLDLLAALFGVESSKDDIDGSMVNTVYYQENDLERISTYCQRDVMVTAQVYLSLLGLPKIGTEYIEYLK